MRILILNGPNLNLLGTREPSIYGQENLDALIQHLKSRFPAVAFSHLQSNHEGVLIDAIQDSSTYDAIVFNAGGYTHTSVALGDAVAPIKTPVIEIHISNVHAREDFRHHSYLSPKAKGIIVGFGLRGYELGLYSFI